MNSYSHFWFFALVAATGHASAQTILYEVPFPSAAAATSLETLGDLDGDGIDDFLAGASGAAGSRGQVLVFSGADGRVLHTLLGDASGDLLGREIATPGDLDGDGREDFVATAPTGQGRSGYVRAWSGADGSELFTTAFDPQAELQPWIVAAVGDLTGDGVQELAVSLARLHNREGDTLVAVLDGTTGAEIDRVTRSVRESFYGAQIARMSDLDGDGAPEFAVAAPSHDSGSGSYGAVFVHSGADRSLLYTITGSADHRTGGAMTSVADRDGDGLDELAIVETRRIAGATYGDVVIRSGRDGSILATMSGDPDRFWATTARLDALGDLDGDDTADLLVSGYWKIGETTQYALGIYSGRSEQLLYVQRDVGQSGFEAASGADLDLDGDDELLVLNRTSAGYTLRALAGAPAFLDVATGQARVFERLEVAVRGRPSTFAALWLTEIDGRPITPVLVVDPGYLQGEMGFSGCLPAGFRARLGFESIGFEPGAGLFRSPISRIDCGM